MTARVNRLAAWLFATLPIFLCSCSPPAELPQSSGGKPQQVSAARNSTEMGVLFAWPEEIQSAGIDHIWGYSPSGNALAVQDRMGDVFIIDLASRVVTSLHRDLLDDLPGHTFAGCDWLSDDRVLTCEVHTTAQQATNVDPLTLVPRESQFVYRAFDLHTRQAVLDVPLGTNGQSFHYAIWSLAATPGLWLVSTDTAYGANLWEFDPVTRTVGQQVFSSGDGERFVYASAGSWLVQVAVPGFVGLPDMFSWRLADSVSLSLVNKHTHAVREARNVPSLWGAPVVTDDGRYVICVLKDPGSQGYFVYVPTVIDTLTGDRVELPDHERWLPLCASTARGVVLVEVENRDSDGQTTCQWFEIPLAQIVPHAR